MVIAPMRSEQADRLLPIVALRIGIHYPQEPVTRERGAGCHHIFCIEQGEGVLETPEGSFPLKAGTAIFMRKDAPVKYYGRDADFTSAWITFLGNGAESLLEYLEAPNIALLQSDHILPMIEDCFLLAENGGTHAELSNAAYNALVTFFQIYRNAKKLPALLQAKRYVEEHYMESLSIGDLATAAGVSESLIFKLFREGEQTPPTAFIRQVRIRKACRMLLSEPDKRISLVAEACGFSDAAYFCKIFHAEIGMTPKKYRDKYEMS